MKAVLISIHPKWVEKIAIGKKTIEVRKSRPNLETPFKCYIYETKDKRFENTAIANFGGGYFEHGCSKVIGEFVCDRITEYKCSSDGFGELATTSGTCLTYDEILNYCNGNDLYGWHISDLKTYDKPKDLSEFKRWNRTEENSPYANAKYLFRDCKECSFCNLKRPPQSWCYVEELQNG